MLMLTKKSWNNGLGLNNTMHTPVYNEPPHQKVPQQHPWRLPQLNFYITDSCALSCEGCVSFNNTPMQNHVQGLTEEVKARLRAWSPVVAADRLYIIGGEPLGARDLAAWIDFIDREFSAPLKTIVTNGRALAQHTLSIVAWLEQGWDLEISSHSPEDFAAAHAWWQQLSRQLERPPQHTRSQDQHGVTDYYTDHEGRPLVQIGERWNFYPQRYQVNEGEIHWQPLTNSGVSHRACSAKTCTYLVDGVMYRCPVQAAIPRLAEQYEIQGTGSVFMGSLGRDPLADNRLSLSAWMNSLNSPQSQCSLCDPLAPLQHIGDPSAKKIKIVKRGSPATVQESLSNPELCEQPLDSNS